MANEKNGNKPAGKRKVESAFADPWKPEKKGETLSGIFLGTQKAEGKRGSFNAYHIKADTGERLSVSGASLETIMAQVPRKTHVVITFEGTQKTDKGDMKVFSVEVPDDVTLLDPFETEDDDS